MPLTARVCVVAPVLAKLTSPENEPDDAPLRRTEMVVAATEPLTGVSESDEENVIPSEETS